MKVFAMTLIACLLITDHSYGCSVYPSNYRTAPANLVEDADVIVVGRYLGIAGEDLQQAFQFQVLERLKGSPSEILELPATEDAPIGDLIERNVDHRDPLFWITPDGRVPVSADCGLHPHFAVGNTYLIVIGSYRTPKSFEQVQDRSDLWYRYIRTLTANASTSLGRNQPLLTAREFLESYDQVALAECPIGNTRFVVNSILINRTFEQATVESFVERNMSCGGGDEVNRRSIVLLRNQRPDQALYLPIEDDVATLPDLGFILIPGNSLSIDQILDSAETLQ